MFFGSGCRRVQLYQQRRDTTVQYADQRDSVLALNCGGHIDRRTKLQLANFSGVHARSQKLPRSLKYSWHRRSIWIR